MTVTVLMTRIVINILLPPLSSPITVVKPYLLLGIGPDCHIVRVGITLQEGSLLGVGQKIAVCLYIIPGWFWHLHTGLFAYPGPLIRVIVNCMHISYI